MDKDLLTMLLGQGGTLVATIGFIWWRLSRIESHLDKINGDAAEHLKWANEQVQKFEGRVSKLEGVKD